MLLSHFVFSSRHDRSERAVSPHSSVNTVLIILSQKEITPKNDASRAWERPSPWALGKSSSHGNTELKISGQR